MRKVIFAALMLVGCGGTDMSNRGQLPTGSADYPLGPYGYAIGAVIGNLQFQVKKDPDGVTGKTAYSDVAAETLNLSDLYADKSVKWLVLTGAAGWCGPCREEARSVPKVSATWEPMGVKFMTILIQGFDQNNQTPSTLADIDSWQVKTGNHIILGIDPKDNLHDFAAEIASFPLNLLIRTSDMTIQYSALGVDPNNPSIEPVLQSYTQ